MLIPKNREQCETSKNSVVVFYTLLTSSFTFYAMASNAMTGLNWITYISIGFLCWSLVEYMLHRLTFHTNLPSMPWNYLTFSLHKYHHSNPQDGPYVPVPFLLSLPVYIIISILIYGLTFSLPITCAIVTGFGFSYVMFEVIHWRCHSETSSGWLTQKYKQYHNHHHFVSSKQNFGVVSPFMDILIGTKAKKQKREN